VYATCGLVEDACKVFDRLHERNVVCWTSMISGYTPLGKFKKAVELFRDMQIAGAKADDATLLLLFLYVRRWEHMTWDCMSIVTVIIFMVWGRSFSLKKSTY
jgi:pentatricopeptide repeat protein